MSATPREISSERKIAYYIGMIIMIIGVLTFLSVFVSFISLVGGFGQSKLELATSQALGIERSRLSHIGPDFFVSCAIRGVGGVVLIWIGGALRLLGSQGLAGSGVVLDPEQARRDLEPWNRAKGGMVQDALSEVDVVNKVAERLGYEDHEDATPREVIKVRCRACQALNDERAKFCSQCGSAL